MSDWIGKFNLSRIVLAARGKAGTPLIVDARLPPYLMSNQHEIEFDEALQ